MTNPIAEIARLLLQAEATPYRELVEHVRSAPLALTALLTDGAARTLTDRLGGDPELWRGYITVAHAAPAPSAPRQTPGGASVEHIDQLAAYQRDSAQLRARRNWSMADFHAAVNAQGVKLSFATLSAINGPAYLTRISRGDAVTIVSLESVIALRGAVNTLLAQAEGAAQVERYARRALSEGRPVIASQIARACGLSLELTTSVLDTSPLVVPDTSIDGRYHRR